MLPEKPLVLLDDICKSASTIINKIFAFDEFPDHSNFECNEQFGQYIDEIGIQFRKVYYPLQQSIVTRKDGGRWNMEDERWTKEDGKDGAANENEASQFLIERVSFKTKYFRAL